MTHDHQSPDPSPPADLDAPPEAPSFVDPAHLHFARAQVQIGDIAPDFVLTRMDGGGTMSLSSLRGKPVVLVFGSFT